MSSRFERPSYAARARNYMAEECKPEVQPPNQRTEKPTFSNPKTVEERQTFKPFGNATNVTANKNLTTYGDMVFMEYNPALFLGARGLTYINKYIEDIFTAFKEDKPLKYLITLKSTDSNTTNDPNKEHNDGKEEPQKWDWWGDDDINTKINNENYSYESESKPYTSIIKMDLLTDVLDKLSFAKKIISEYRMPIVCDSSENASIQFRDVNVSPNNTTGLFTPRALQNKSKTQAPGHADILIFDDNCSVRVSNFTNHYDLSPYDIKDILCEYIGDIKYKVSIPKDKETNFNKDFAFLNFQNETDMMTALSALQSQRIFYDSSILCFELSKRRFS